MNTQDPFNRQVFRIQFKIAETQLKEYNEDVDRSIFAEAFQAVDTPSFKARVDRNLAFLYDYDTIRRVRDKRQYFAKHVADIIEAEVLKYLARNDTVDGYKKESPTNG